ncbi:MAG: RDD family protein, partial [Planctomycetota bacterium]
PEPASMLLRVSTGWIDYLIAFLPPYVALMFLIGSHELLVRPLVDRTLESAKYYFLLLGCGFLYFTIVEGIWGAGIGKWLKGLRVIRANGRPPGVGRALIRIFIPIGCVEVVRMPLSMTFISEAEWTGLQTAGYVVAAIACGWIPALLALRARPDNGFATAWDLASGTRVVIKPKGTQRPTMKPAVGPVPAADGADSLGPYLVIEELVPAHWLVGTDPVLRRRVWLLRRDTGELPVARRNVARSGRLRWLQNVETGDVTWDAFEAPGGMPFPALVSNGKRVPWSTLRHWLHDLASELWDATGDQTLPDQLSLDHVWITVEGRAVLLDEPWPEVNAPAERIPVSDVAGQQRFLNTVAACVESTGLPLHARPVLQNLEDGKFEKLSFLTGTLRGLLEKPAEVSTGIRAGSIFMLPLYVWIAIVVGRYHDKPWDDPWGIVLFTAVVVLGAMALADFVGLLFRGTVSHSIFRLAIVNGAGQPAARPHLLSRWAIVWLPLLLSLSLVAWLVRHAVAAGYIVATALLLLWLGAAIFAIFHPHRGLHDRLAGTWVVRR